MVGMSKRNSLVLILFITTIWNCELSSYISSDAKNDPWPVYTTLDPHTFLYTRELQPYHGEEMVSPDPQYFGFSLSPFGQNACVGKGYINPVDMCEEVVTLSLGDLEGTWGLVPMLFGRRPECVCSLPPVLQLAFDQLYPGQEWGTVDGDFTTYDQCRNIGFVSFPIKYRKRGFRAEFDFRVTNGFGMILQGGASDICQLVNKVLLCSGDCTCCPIDAAVQTKIKTYLLCKNEEIARQLGINIGNFHNVSIEDIRLIGYWRHAYEVNKDRVTWPHFLATPFLTFGGSIGVAKPKIPCCIFSLPFGNNGHHSVGASAGMDIDFVETVAVGGEAGITHFFSRRVCDLRIPNSIYQTNIFPFTADAVVSPGLNWHFGMKMQAYHFLDRLSVYFQYMMITHREDCIRLCECNPALLPCVLEKRSCWRVQLANIGFNYDISPYCSLGFLWQAPLIQKNAYVSSTVMFSFSAAF